MPKRKKFIVEGIGPFPFDMLRYDACWPRSESLDSPGLETNYEKRRCVTLLSDWKNAPTKERWQSFMWKVVWSGNEHDDPAYGGKTNVGISE